MSIRNLCIMAITGLLISGCSGGGWFGEDEPEIRLEGERIAIMAPGAELVPDTFDESDTMNLGPVRNTKAWPQEGLLPIHAVGQLKLSPQFTSRASASIGEGNGWETSLVPSPVVGDGKVFAMDARGYISAHDQRDIGRVLWVSDAATLPEVDEIIGGGLAYANGRLFVVSGHGVILALDAASGTQKWKRDLHMPFRAPPTLIGTYMLTLSVTNQIFALNMADGTLLWSHEGVKENTNYLSALAPAADKDFVVVPYSSGEIIALTLDNGRPVWGDALTLPRRTTAYSSFSGIGGHPVIAGDAVYAVSANGLLIASAVASGKNIWEREFSSLHTPWLAGDYLFALSTSNHLVAMERFTGRIRWVTDLRSSDTAEESLRLFNPVLVSGEVIIPTNGGQLLRVRATDGALLEAIELPTGVATSPVITNGVLYLVGSDATLHALQ